MTQSCVWKLWMTLEGNDSATMATLDVKLDRILYFLVVIFMCSVVLYQLAIPLVTPSVSRNDILKDFDIRENDANDVSLYIWHSVLNFHLKDKLTCN